MDTDTQLTYTVTLTDRTTGADLDFWFGVVAWSLPGGSWLQVTCDTGAMHLVQVDPGHAVSVTPDAD